MAIPPHVQPYRRLPVFIFAILLVTVISTLSIVYYVQNRLVAVEGEKLALAAADIADKLDRILFERYGDIQVFAKHLSLQTRKPEALGQFLAEAKRAHHSSYLWLGVVNAQGRIVAATDPASVGKDRSDREWFTSVRDHGGIHVRDARPSEDSGGVMAVAFTAPLRGPRGEFIGAVTSRVGLPALEDVFAWTVRAFKVQAGGSENIEYQFLARDGDVLADSLLHQEGTLNLRQLGLLSALMAGSAQPGYVEEMHLRRKVPVVTGFAQTEGYGAFTGLHWGVLIRKDRSDILAPINRFLGRLGGVLVLVTGPLLIGLIWTTGRLRREHEQVTAAAAVLRELNRTLHEERTRLAVTLHSIGDGVIATDAAGTIVLMNAVAEGLTGWTQEDAVGRPLPEVFHIISEVTRERCENPVERVLTTGGIIGLANHTALLAKDGTLRSIADSGAPIRNEDGTIIGVVVVFRDVTERVRMEQELLTARKLESLGVLAGGIAHDFNNILTAILGNLYLAKITAKPGDEQAIILGEAERATLRARGLTQQLLTFAKGGAPVKRTLSLSDVLKETVRFALQGSNVRAEFSLAADLWLVTGDEGQLGQVFHNLALNAQQAMPGGGTVTVRAENLTLGTPMPPPLLDLPGGPYVRIVMTDQGIGIPPDHLRRVFDPYFTTKQFGHGLGLATTYSIIKHHGGGIHAESALGAGTTFSVYLPASPETVLRREQNTPPGRPGPGRVLVMDDEESLRTLFNRMLTRCGLEVHMARDSAEAIALYQRALASDLPYAVVILDLTIPGGRGGADTLQELRGIDPHVKAIVTSGYADDPVLARYAEYGFKGRLAKPFTFEELSAALNLAMTARA